MSSAMWYPRRKKDFQVWSRKLTIPYLQLLYQLSSSLEIHCHLQYLSHSTCCAWLLSLSRNKSFLPLPSALISSPCICLSYKLIQWLEQVYLRSCLGSLNAHILVSVSGLGGGVDSAWLTVKAFLFSEKYLKYSIWPSNWGTTIFCLFHSTNL